MKKTGYIFVVIAIAIVASVFLYKNYNKTVTGPVSGEVDTSKWVTYTDEKYGFSYMAPPQDEFDPKDYFNINPVYQNPEDIRDLTNYTENFWNERKNEKNPNLPNPMPVSDLEKIYLNGREAYRFTQEVNFNGINQDYPENKYNRTNILASNQNGQLFWAFYRTESAVAKKILSTLIIDTSLIPSKIEPGDWRVIKDDYPIYYSFSYPANILTDESCEDGYLVCVLNVSSKRGSMTVSKYDYFDQTEMKERFEKDKYTKKVKIGNLYGYESKGGEGGNFGTWFTVFLDDRYTLSINFSSNEKSIYPIASDTELQKQILSTFKFEMN